MAKRIKEVLGMESSGFPVKKTIGIVAGSLAGAIAYRRFFNNSPTV